MSTEARYSGECPECGERWQPGDLIRTGRTEPGNLNVAIWQHAVCPDTPSPVIHPICDACWLAHPEGEADR